MNIPSADTFDAHGLYDIDVDLSGTRDLGQSATGWATYRPSPDSPLLDKELEDEYSGRTVKFYWCSTDKPEAARTFRRCCQIWAIETLARKDDDEKTAVEPKGILGWWEQDGLWMIAHEPKVETVSLAQWWAARLAEQQPDVDGPSDTQDEVYKRDSRGMIYADACDLFVSLSRCNQRLHRKHLVLLSTRLAAYGVLPRPSTAVELCRWPDIFAMAELSLPCLLSGTPLEGSALFSECTIDRSNRLDDARVKQFLRYLAPEVVGSRQLNLVSDIFAIGVVMYEILTGTTIDGGPETPDIMTIDVLQDFQRHVLLEVPTPHEMLLREANMGSYTAELPPVQLSTIIMKCIAKDVEDRYGSIDALCYDLARLGQVIRNNGDLSKFQIGVVDRISRFALPAGMLHRSEEFQSLNKTLDDAAALADTEVWSSKTVMMYGLSGAGKSRVLLEWIRQLEAQGEGRKYLVSYAKVDEHINRPLASFTQLFDALLERIFADGKEDVEEWRRRINELLDTHLDTFLRLLSPSSQRLLAPERRVTKQTDTIEWTNFLPAFQSWSSRLLQLFGTQSRPLVLVIDDCQWLESSEVTMWRNLLEGDSALDFVMVASAYRVEDDNPPAASTMLSTASTQIHIKRLPEDGVAEFVNTCFHDCLDKSSNLISFLYAETGGSPLYLRSLLSILVREHVIYFDFDMLLWRYDPLALQGHLTNREVDAFLDKVLRGFPDEVQEALVILSCLPSIGVPTYLLAEILHKPLLEVETSLVVSDSAGCTTMIESARGLTAKFTHDRYRMAAHGLVPAQEQAATLIKVSDHLGVPALREQYLLVAADLALNAKDKGCPGSLDHFMGLMLAAAEKSTQHASFPAAKRFLDGYESVIDHAGGLETVIREQRDGYFQYLRLVSEVYGVLKIASEAYVKISNATSYCQTPAEEVKLALYQVRIKIWSSCYAEAMELLLDTLRRQGYDPDHPEKLNLRAPKTLAEVETYLNRLDRIEYNEDDDVRMVLATLICVAGSTIFVTLPNYWVTIFTLAISLIGDIGILQETTPYLLSVYALSVSDIAVRQALCENAQRFAIERMGSHYTSSALVGIAAQVHCWFSLEAVEKSMSSAYALTFAHGSYEIAAYVVALDLGTQIFASRPINWTQAGLRYKSLRSVASKVMRATMEIPLQYAECLASYSSDRPPWSMEGTFLSDSSAFRNLSLQEAMWHCCSLRLAILYDAPLDVQMDIIGKGHIHTAAAAPLVYGPQWKFLCALTLMRTDPKDKRIAQARTTLEKLSRNVDFAYSLKVLDALEALYKDAFTGIKAVDALCRELVNGFTNLHGLLCLLTGQHILAVTGSEALACGYFLHAAKSLGAIGGFGVRQMLNDRFPGCIAIPDAEKQISIPTMMKSGTIPAPVLRRAPPSNSNDTSNSDVPIEEDTNSAENLDTITLMRSSLALASEQDPQVLMATLLRVLCQYVRADYAAIALADPEDAATFRLVASGTYERITTRDLLLADESAHRVCPAPLMLKVARTSKPMTKMSTSSRDWFDSFYGNKTPRTAICLPISAQGRQAGVILLSSMVIDNPRARSAAAREVVSCLATFATLVAINQSFTRRLKREVDERTKQLRDALAAKTQFLSQCSHELRSPLSAVLGLATVLRESPGLSEVQREHLQTIQSSGEDLLGLINNILDVSRLENSSVSLERTPFSIRDVVEAALDTLASSAQTKNLEVCLISSFKSDPPGVYGDSFRVKQVLLNLLSNAVKFTSKGKVTVRWSYEEKPDNRIMISLIVEDSGIGIPAQKMDKLFQTFSQVDESITRSYGGSGLGLVISRDLARLMGGDCSAESEYGRGSKFTFSFLAERNDEAKTDYEVFRSPRSCFVLCPLGPSWPMLEANLSAFNCQPVRFEAELKESMEKGFPEGLNSNHDFHFVFVDVDMLNHEAHDEMRRLQPKAKFVYMCNSIELAKAMKKFDLTRESILARPIKLASLYNVLIPAGDSDTPNRPKMQGRSRNSANKVNKRLAEEAPLSILLVDDNNTNLLVGRRILEMLGYKNIPSASDGLQGFEQAEKKQYDLILMDLQMPVMDGFTSLARIQESPLTGAPCVVALTANADMATQKRCEEAGFFTYLSKPLNLIKFETTLRSVHQHRQLHSTEHQIDQSARPGKEQENAQETPAAEDRKCETVDES